MTHNFEGTIKNGRVKLKHIDAFNNLVASFQEGSQVRISIGRFKHNRSENQNRYYWGVVVHILAEHLGYFPEEMHEALKLHFLKKEANPLPTVRSTTSLDTAEFEDYLEKVRMWAMTEHEVKIPMPNEMDFEA